MADKITYLSPSQIEYHPQYVQQVAYDTKEAELLDEQRRATWLSIKKTGQVKEPIHVQPAGNKYHLLNGGDRFEGAMKAKLKQIPAIVHSKDIDSSERRLLMFGLNHARKTHGYGHYVDILRSEFSDDEIIEERRGGEHDRGVSDKALWILVRNEILGGKSERTARRVIEAAKKQILAERKIKPRFGHYELEEGFINYGRRLVEEAERCNTILHAKQEKYRAIKEKYNHEIGQLEKTKREALSKITRGAPSEYRKMFRSPQEMVDHFINKVLHK